MSDNKMNRRTFIRQSACAALGATSLVNTLSYLRLTNAAAAETNSLDTDYKALVCIFLSGGNDSNNLLIPIDGELKDDYVAARPAVALTSNLNELTMPTTAAFDKYYGGSQFKLATHPNTPELASLFNSGDLAFVANVGTLVAPIPTRDHLLNELVPLPENLFAHAEQQMAWQTSIAQQAGTIGWGGRTADLLAAAYNNPETLVSMNISFTGDNIFQAGVLGEITDASVAMGSGNKLDGFGNSHPDGSFYKAVYEEGTRFPNAEYKVKNDPRVDRIRTLDKLLALSNENMVTDEVTNRIIKARTLNESGVLTSAITAGEASGVDFETAFANAPTDLGEQLQAVAKMIVGRNTFGNKRQIFFVTVGGFDTHESQTDAHANLMTELSSALKAFRDVLVEAEDWDKVVAFTASDFNRTLNSNSDGTDHAWGGHSIVMGGPVSGQNVYGHFPSMKTGDHPLSIDGARGRGRFIPSVSVDQYGAVMTKWFGASSSAMETIFPNFGNFNNPFTTTEPNLGFIPDVMNL